MKGCAGPKRVNLHRMHEVPGKVVLQVLVAVGFFLAQHVNLQEKYHYPLIHDCSAADDEINAPRRQHPRKIVARNRGACTSALTKLDCQQASKFIAAHQRPWSVAQAR